MVVQFSTTVAGSNGEREPVKERSEVFDIKYRSEKPYFLLFSKVNGFKLIDSSVCQLCPEVQGTPEDKGTSKDKVKQE